jgi:tRNA(Ile2) C34 agmatinyltransferase TiaS
MGKGQGYRCRKCGVKLADAGKVKVAQARGVELGLHVTSTRSQRHLTKPLRRYGLEKQHHAPAGMIQDWHS